VFTPLPNRRAVAVLAILATLIAAPARACFDVDTSPNPYIWFTSATTVQLAIEGATVKAAGLTIGDYCAVGLGHSGTLITGVTALAVMDDADPTGSPTPIAGFAFGTNPTTTADFGTAAPSSTWQGFHSAVSAAIPGSTYVALVFTITVPAGTTYADIIDELQGFGFLGSDDANAGGNLQNTNQGIDGIVGVTELPECFDDVIQPGEVCDGASEMGCSPGDTCVDCSACVTAGLAESCKSKLIRDVSNNLKKKLKCYAKRAKQGLAVDPLCLSAVLDLSVIWPKYTQSCPQTFPTPGSITTYVDTLGSDLATTIAPLGTPGPETKCAANKFKAASYRAVGKIKCHSKALASNVPVSPTCLTTVEAKYTQKYNSAENVGCAVGNTGNSPAIEGFVDTFVSPDLVGSIPP
jgi:hypothetical protein